MKASAALNRGLLVRMTVVFAILVGANAALNVSGPGGFAVALGVSLLLNVVYVGMVAVMVNLPEKAEGVGQLWAGIRPVLAVMIWTALVFALGVAIGIFFLILPAVFLATIWSVAIQAIVAERLSVFQALKRSQELTLRNFWRVLAAIMLIVFGTLVAYALAFLVAVPLGTSLVGAVAGTFVLVLIAYPVGALVPACLYKALVTHEAAERELDRDRDRDSG